MVGVETLKGPRRGILGRRFGSRERTARMRNRRFRRFWADLWACYRTQDCQNRLEITKDSKDTKQAAQGAGRACAQGAAGADGVAGAGEGGPCVRARRTSGPEACRGVAGFARHALVLGNPTASAAVLCVLYVLLVLPRRLAWGRRYRSAPVGDGRGAVQSGVSRKAKLPSL